MLEFYSVSLKNNILLKKKIEIFLPRRRMSNKSIFEEKIKQQEEAKKKDDHLLHKKKQAENNKGGVTAIGNKKGTANAFKKMFEGRTKKKPNSINKPKFNKIYKIIKKINISKGRRKGKDWSLLQIELQIKDDVINRSTLSVFKKY